jgi:hypothetical protein
MSSNTPTAQLQQAPYLREQRNFPNHDQILLAKEVDQAYIDIAGKVNKRVIGTYAVNFPIITGERWFLAGTSKQQTLRQLYVVTGPGTIAHGINVANITGFTRIYGTFTDNTFWYPLPYVSSVSAADQVEVYLDSVNINIVAGGGAPTVVSGWIILEWLSDY